MRNTVWWRESRGGCALLALTIACFAVICVPFVWLLSRPAALAVAAVAWMLVAAALPIRGRPPIVLYLRRFGDTETPERFGGGLAEHLVRNFRIIALSDPVTNPIITSTPETLGCVAGFVVVMIPFELLIRFGGAHSWVIWVSIVLLPAMLPLTRFFQRRFRSRARRRVAATIETPADLENVEARAQAWRKRSFANSFARIVAIRVTDALWRSAVSSLAKYADVILIDVSTPGPSLTWEVETLRGMYDDHLVLVASEKPDDPVLRERVILRGGGFRNDLRRALWAAVARTSHKLPP